MVMKAPLLPIWSGGGGTEGREGGPGKGFFLYKVTHHRVTRSELEFQVISHGHESSLIAHTIWSGEGKGLFLYKVTHHRVTRSELEFQVISHGHESSLIAHTIWSGEGKGLFSLQSNSPQSYT